MPYFLSDINLQTGQLSPITGEEADHILLARRAKTGEYIKVQGPDGKRYMALIAEIKKHELVIKPTEEVSVPAELSLKIVLFQSVVAANALDVILQKATELGAAEIILFNSQYTATQLSAQKFQYKQERLQKILWEAAKQSERAHPPVLSFVNGVKNVADRAAELDELFIFDITGNKIPSKTRQSAIGAVIGPEGGLSEAELKALAALPNAKLVTLGSILLKADTAALAALAIIQNL